MKIGFHARRWRKILTAGIFKTLTSSLNRRTAPVQVEASLKPSVALVHLQWTLLDELSAALDLLFHTKGISNGKQRQHSGLRKCGQCKKRL
jgi:hypothetical protein